MRRRAVTAVIAAVGALLLAAPAWAVRIHPEVEAQLAALPPGGQVSVIVELKDQVDPAAAAALAPSSTRQARLRAIVDRLRDHAARQQTAIRSYLAAEQAAQRVRAVTPLWILNGLAVTASEPVIRALATRPDVAEIRPDRPIPPPPRPVPAPASESPSVMGVQWNIDRIRAPEVWALDPRYNGSGAVVGSFDTGVDGTHPDLQPRYRGNHATSWFDPYGQHATPYDADGHGTHTVGTMVGGEAGGSAIGVAPGASWIAAKAWDDSGNASTSKFHQIFQWFLAPGGDPANAPDVINGSWAFTEKACITEFQRDIQALRSAGIFPAFAAGNSGSGSGTILSPGAYAESFAVGATTSSDTVASYSSRGPSPCTTEVKPDVTAPGSGIRSSVPGNRWASYSGTSMATPHVAGAVAVLRSIKPSATVAELEKVLTETAVDLGAAGPDGTYGYGRLDLYAAAQRLLEGAPPPPAPADLVVAALSAPGSARPGAAVTVDETTKNQGQSAAGASTTKIYLSTNGTLDGGDTLLGSRSVPSLGAGAGSSGSTTVTIPASTAAGTYYLIARADADGTVAESNEGNNTASMAITVEAAAPTVDLVVSALSAPASAAPGASVTVSDTTKNQGTGSAGASTTKIYLSTNGTLDSGDTLLGSRSVPSLGAGAGSSGSTTVTIPASTAAGTYYLIARADADGAVGESDEANNTAARQISVQASTGGVADLAVTTVSAGYWVSAGRGTLVRYTIRNQGTAGAPATTTRIYLSRTATLDGGAVALGSRSTPALGPGQWHWGSAAVTIPSDTAPGTYYIVVQADADDAVVESQATNNLGADRVRVFGSSSSSLGRAVPTGPAATPLP